MAIREATKAVLEPYVGPMVADTCIRATAISLGKTSDDLTGADLPAMVASIRKLLAPIAPAASVDRVVEALNVEMQKVV